MNREDIPQGPSFRPWCVRAIQAGCKSQTRRALKRGEQLSQAIDECNAVGTALVKHPNTGDYWIEVTSQYRHAGPEKTWWLERVPYQPGEIYYVREAVKKVTGPNWPPQGIMGYVADGSLVRYKNMEPYEWAKAGREPYQVDKLPAIFMPKRAARYFILVKDVWPEEYGEISAEDARSEGVTHHPDWRMQGWHGREAAFFNEIVLPGIHDEVPDWLLAYEFETLTREQVEEL